MTLVVACLKNGIIAAVSDTGVTEHDQALSPERQIPKICIVTPDLAVAFAGASELAIRYLENFPPIAIEPYKTTVEYLLRCHQDAHQSVDFLALFHKPVPKVVAIRDGRVFPTQSTAWIGDQSAFGAFQQHRHSRSGASRMEMPLIQTVQPSEANPDNTTFAMLGALRNVLIDTNIASVFGFGIAVNNLEGFFSYRSYTFILAEREISPVLPISVLRQIAPERVELKEYAASCFVSHPAGVVQAVAFHFPRGRLTYMYFGTRGKPLTEVRTITTKNIKEFMADTAAEFAISWIGVVTLRTRPLPEYGVPLNEWRPINSSHIIKRRK